MLLFFHFPFLVFPLFPFHFLRPLLLLLLPRLLLLLPLLLSFLPLLSLLFPFISIALILFILSFLALGFYRIVIRPGDVFRILVPATVSVFAAAPRVAPVGNIMALPGIKFQK